MIELVRSQLKGEVSRKSFFVNRNQRALLKFVVNYHPSVLSRRVSGHRWTANYTGHRCCLVQDALKGKIPEHVAVFNSTMSQQHGYNTRNAYMPKISRTRTEWGRNKTYYKAINDWALLPSELKRLMPKNDF